MEKENYMIYPIGYIRRKENKIFLEINKEYLPALKELEKFSHAHVIWWFNKLDDVKYRKITQTEPPYQAPKLGVFASRSPIRPNPIALSIVKILTIDFNNGIIEIPQIDALDNTPILDIKAYFPSCDRLQSPKLPDWAKNWPKWLPEDGLGLE
ncbi:tRNA (N6-threonylcarbamoyladenosine(37)-N6)-methyltransferase TrmO [Mycoplasmatota bacterium]|nr:tRNA (N6-threonylcarbamoyladenosine(37)-N6)-methyltransferase TrmO [Mycoplasmatota bacterium]